LPCRAHEQVHWKEKRRKPEWMKRAAVPGGDRYTAIKSKLRELKLSTVHLLTS
jgi:lipoyl synthase